MGTLVANATTATALVEEEKTTMPPSKSKSIALKAYHSPDGRCIHYSVACLRKNDGSAGAAFVDVDNVIGRVKTCWVFFYPAGPNRRLLELVLARYAPNFDCNEDVLFLCVNRPGKGGTSSSGGNKDTPEKDYVNTACQDVVSILDYYQVPKASLFYMCAGSSFAYSFVTKHPDRTTGYIIGVSSWILRSSTFASEENEESPQIHSNIHRMAMNGVFGPKWFVSSLSSGSISSMNGLLGLVPSSITLHYFKKTLSEPEKVEFVQMYGDRDGEGFIDDLSWMNEDGYDGNGSEFVNSKDAGKEILPNNYDGNANDISVCLTTQEDLGLIYNKTIPELKQVFLFHGTYDKMISVHGSEYLESNIPHAELHKVAQGTHQGTMFFYPEGVAEAINTICSEVSEVNNVPSSLKKKLVA